jgi:hypothetical protein
MFFAASLVILIGTFFTFFTRIDKEDANNETKIDIFVE